MSSLKKSGREYWRSLGELSDPEGHEKRSRDEFETPPDQGPQTPGRRRFMQLMGASLALSGCRFEEDHLLPHAKRPDGLIPGKPQFFATTMELGGVAWGLLARSYEGRPIKLEPNPDHPGGGAGTTSYHQAAVLELYDPDRSQGVAKYSGGNRTASDAAGFVGFAKKHFGGLKAKSGAGLRVLAQTSSSPTRADMKKRFLEAFPQAKWYEYAPLAHDGEAAGTKLAFGTPQRVHVNLRRADVIVTLDDDLLCEHPNSMNHARDFASRRDPDEGKMNRLYAVEAGFSQTGAAGDHRIALRSSLIKSVAAYLDSVISPKVSAPGTAQAKPAAGFLKDKVALERLNALTEDLLQNRGRSVVTVGAHQPAVVHALAARLNVILGNVGKTVHYSEIADAPSGVAQLSALVKEMGGVDTLLILGGNPVYDAPADLDFKAALGKAKHAVHLSLYEDETSQLCEWHVPEAHWLEVWGDGLSYSGTISLAQPLIAPLFGGKSAIEFLALVTGDEKQNGTDLVKRTHEGLLSGKTQWRKATHDGFVRSAADAGATGEAPALSPFTVKLSAAELGGTEVPEQLEVLFATDSKLYDGRFANNGWLQELPDLAGKLTWDNAALVSPATATKLGVTDQDLVTLTLDGRSLKVAILQAPGQANGTIKLALGYGRTAAGRIGGSKKLGVAPVGFDSYQLRTSKAFGFAVGVTASKAPGRHKLATTQDKHSIDELGAQGAQERIPSIIRSATLKQYNQRRDFAKHVVHHPPLLSLWEEPIQYTGNKWGLTIDLNKCVGCGTCTIACQAENNIPVVGKERVLFGREMHWIRVDRYYKGSPDDPKMVTQPLACHHCDHAPCEEVCPVGATMHTREGLNDMVYNRCIGTRYCAANCPYKVRRFNYFNFHMDMKEEKNKVKAMVFNPEVTVRFRGVMEKCSFCVQRIQNAKIDAKNKRVQTKKAKDPGPLVPDGTIQTACQQSCPSDAIEFGDLNDKKSKVLAKQYNPRSYALLGHLNVRPRLLYLAKIENLHPKLEPKENPHAAHGGGHAAGDSKAKGDDHAKGDGLPLGDDGKSHGAGH